MEKLLLFDKSLMTLEYLHKTMLSFKGMRFCPMFGSNQKKRFEKLIEIQPYLSPFLKMHFYQCLAFFIKKQPVWDFTVLPAK